MKFIIIFLTIVLFGISISILNAQNHNGDYQVKPPDVSAFEAVNFSKANEYSGKIAISIPIFEFSIDGVSIPISIDYNSSGILVNERASRVGLGWSLQAGGMISKSIKGFNDFELSKSAGESGGATSGASWFTSAFGNSFGDPSGNITAVYTKMGYLKYCDPSNCTFEVDLTTLDTEPDIYNVRVPGLNTDFIHTRIGSVITPKEISPKGTIISSSILPIGKDYAGIYNFIVGQYPYNTTPYAGDETTDVQSVNITSNNGILYQFNDIEHVTNRQIISLDNYNPLQTRNYINISYPISRIFSQRTGQEVNFHYENVELFEFENYVDRIVKRGKINTYSEVEHENSIWLKKVIKIDFDEGTILFHYDHDRLDILGETALTEIEIKDLNGQMIKRVLFNYSYYTTPGSTSYVGKRLKFDQIYFENKERENLPGYNFTYNSTPLPERYAASADFSGYYNGARLLQDVTDFPTQYFYIDPNKSLLPFQIDGDTNYYQIQGTYSLEADEIYAKAGQLNQIEYPTGGKSVFDYELNSFEYLGQEIKGGGLRIKRNTLYDTNQTILRDIVYDYKKTDGNTSGSIITLPKHSTAELYDGDHVSYFSISNYIDYSNLTITNVPDKLLFKISNSSVNRFSYTKGNLVGYSRVKKEELGNGYEIKEYSSPSSILDIYPSAIAQASGPTKSAVSNWIQFQIDYGFFPTLYENKEALRGNLTNHSVFDNTDQLLQHTKYTFDRKQFESFRLTERKTYSTYCRITSGWPYDDINFNLERNELIKVEQFNYLQGNVLKNTEEFIYDSFNGLLKEKSFLTSDQRTKKTLFTYPEEGSPDNFIQNLFDQNRINKPIKKTNFIDNTKIGETIINYNEYNEKTEPSVIEVFKGESTEGTPVITFEAYDSKANPVQYKTINNIPTAILWGYNKTKIVSKVIGSTYNELIATGIDEDIVNNPDGISELNIELNKIQLAFENDPLKKVETYIYKPLIGVTQITDLRNQTASFEYDNFNRFSLSKDNDGNIITKNEYNLKNSQTYPVSISAFLDFEYIGDNQYRVTANASGGSGGYTYQWGANCHYDFEPETSNNTYIAASYQPIPDENNFPCYDNQSRDVPVTCKIRDNNENIEIIRTVILERIIELPPPIFHVYLTQTGYEQIDALAIDGSGDFSYQWKENNDSYSSLSSDNTHIIQTMLECEDEGGDFVAVTCRVVDNVTGEVITNTINVYASVGCQG
jgi:hypothetical protein